MHTIEIWKAKSAWGTQQSLEQKLLLQNLAALVKRNRSDAGDDPGPYIVEKPEHALLIWSHPVNDPQLSQAYRRIGLHAYFEPLTFVYASSHRTAGELAKQFAI